MFENVNFSITVLISLARLYVIDNKLGKIEDHRKSKSFREIDIKENSQNIVGKS